MQIPILTYHSLNTTGPEYDNNDHVALETDLELLKTHGFRVERLTTLVDAFNAGRLSDYRDQKICALTFDDGVTHDFVDFYHPARGLLKSFARILGEAADSSLNNWAIVPATSFVIVSPAARDILDVQCIAGRGQWHDHWWEEAVSKSNFDIGNHSWDHTHPTLPKVAQREQIRGNFFCIDNRVDAHHQILDAEAYLTRKLGDRRSRLFAYPYGHVSSYLCEEFFPEHQREFKAAFATGGGYFTQESNRWAIPRFVCGEDWGTPEGLLAILRGQAGRQNNLHVVHTGVADDSANDTGHPSLSGTEILASHNAQESAPTSPSGERTDTNKGSLPDKQNTNLAPAPFFLVGCVRSGTTLLRELLKQHPNLHAPEETHLFRWPHAFGTVDFTHIQKHNETLRAHRELDGVAEEQYEVLLNAATSRRTLQDGYAELFFESQNIAAGRWFDKTPQNIYGILLLSAVYPEAQFVHIVRHPLNVVTSLKAGKVMGPHSLGAAINTWLEAVAIAHEFCSAWPDRMYTLTYENLTQSPKTEMRALLDFLGEPASEGNFDFTRVHPERDRFQEDLTEQEQNTVRKRLATEMARYGYS